MMYNISNKIIIALIVFKGFCSYAQEIIVPIKPNVELNRKYMIDNNAYLKDVNGDLDKFVGVWIGNYQGNEYELRIEKHTDNAVIGSFKKDMLIMRHLIKSANGAIINSTLSLAIDEPFVTRGFDFRSPSSYDFLYGADGVCGFFGRLNIRAITSTSIKLIFVSNHELLNMTLCPGGAVPSLFPTEAFMFLTKQ